MPRRIQWGFVLLVVLGFVAPGAAHASAAAATRASGSPVLLSSSSGPRVPDYAPVVVRSVVDLEDWRSERGGGLKRGSVGTGSTNRPACPCSSRDRCVARGAVARSFSSSTVALRAPPPCSA